MEVVSFRLIATSFIAKLISISLQFGLQSIASNERSEMVYFFSKTILRNNSMFSFKSFTKSAALTLFFYLVWLVFYQFFLLPRTYFDEYLIHFGEPKISDPDLTENIADLICEKKKLPKSTIFDIKKNIESNMKLIFLDTGNIPETILDKMNKVYTENEN